MRTVRVGLAALLLTGAMQQAQAQVVYRDCTGSREECAARARDVARELDRRIQRLADERWARDMEAKFRAEYQRERMREGQGKARAQQERMRAQQMERARAQRQMALEHSHERRQREQERALELRLRDMERARERREWQMELERQSRERAMERAVMLRESPPVRRDYIAPPPGVRIRPRGP